MSPTVYMLIALIVVLFAASKVGNIVHRRKMEAAPRMTQAEIDSYWSSIHAATLPMAKITIVTSGANHPAQSRIGGKPFADAIHAAWPVSSRDGQPMLFLAQINFADLPPMADFPQVGLMQLFAAVDHRGHIENTESPEDRALRWFPDPAGTATLTVPDVFRSLKKRGTLSLAAMRDGLALRFKAAEAQGNPFNWPFALTEPDFENRLGETPEVQSKIDGWEQKNDNILESYGTHWVGGHPRFTQEDVRHDPDLQSLNRLILHLGFDDDVCLGDAGDLNLMIAVEDLKNRDFQRAYCAWDCG